MGMCAPDVSNMHGEEGTWQTPKSIGKIMSKIDNLELKMRKISTSKDRGCEPPNKPQVAPPRHRGGGSQIRGAVRMLDKPNLTVVKIIVVSDETIIVVDHKTVLKVVAPVVDILATLLGQREICQVMDEVEVDLIKVQMLADLELQVEQFQEVLPDVTIARNQAIYLDFVKDDKRMKIG